MQFPANPDAAVLALLAGVLLIELECNRPGSIIPGCFGLLLVMLSLNTLHQLPLRLSALALLFFGFALVMAEVLIPARCLLAGLGTAALIGGFVTLLQPFAAARVHLITAIVAGAGLGLPALWLSRVALRARRNKRILRHPAVVQDRLNEPRCS